MSAETDFNREFRRRFGDVPSRFIFKTWLFGAFLGSVITAAVMVLR